MTVGTVVFIAVLAAFPLGSMAKGGNFVIKPSRTMEFSVKGSKGYSITVSASRGVVSLTASHGGSSATYTTPGKGSPMAIEARFGKLGEVSMRFRSDRGPRLAPLHDRSCHGKGEYVDSGTWVGKVRFAGEQGYTMAHATRARGKIVRTLKETFKREAEGGSEGGVHFTILEAISEKSGTFVTGFRIESPAHPDQGGSVFGASVVEVHGRRLSVVRSITVTDKVDAFVLTEEGGRITSATISPSGPFEGSATFTRTSGEKGTWSGSLVGDFPGRENVALASPGFSAEISN